MGNNRRQSIQSVVRSAFFIAHAYVMIHSLPLNERLLILPTHR